jgi:PAS domain S-box-containing protein
VPLHAVAISVAALLVPLFAERFAAEGLALYQPLVWLTCLIPPFLLSYYRGWQGATLAFAIGMAVLSLWNGLTAGLGRSTGTDSLHFVYGFTYVTITLAAGWVTELLHRSREQAQARSIDLVLRLDRSGVVTAVSESSERILGLTAQQVMGRRLHAMVHPDDQRLLPGLLAPDGAIGLRSRREVRVGNAAEGWRTLELMRDEHPRAVQLRGRDVTELKQVEEQTRRAAHMEMLSRITAGLAHDFNNSFTAIQGHAAMLRNDLQEPHLREGIDEIQRASDRVGALVSQLLAYTRQQVLSPRAVELDELVRSQLPALRHILGERIRLHASFGGRRLHGRVDPVQLRNALITLASRARRVMPEGGEVVIQTDVAELTTAHSHSFNYPVQLGRYVVLAITDSGPLLELAARERIFEPFAGAPGDSGLALPSVYGFVKQSGGYIWAEAERERGTTFRIYLPLAEAPRQAPAEARTASAQLTGARVLVVEDDVAVRSLVRVLLLRRGYSVLEACDGQEAWDVLTALDQPIDLLITDLIMPRMRGEALAANVLERQPDLRVLFMSGFVPEAAAPAVRNGQRPPFLHKPFSPDELLHAVNSALLTGAGATSSVN